MIQKPCGIRRTIAICHQQSQQVEHEKASSTTLSKTTLSMENENFMYNVRKEFLPLLNRATTVLGYFFFFCFHPNKQTKGSAFVALFRDAPKTINFVLPSISPYYRRHGVRNLKTVTT